MPSEIAHTPASTQTQTNSVWGTRFQAATVCLRRCQEEERQIIIYTDLTCAHSSLDDPLTKHIPEAAVQVEVQSATRDGNEQFWRRYMPLFV